MSYVVLKADTIAFLARNNFDFNKLFTKAIGYTKMSDLDKVYEKCVSKVGRYYPDKISLEALSTAHEKEFVILQKKIRDWVYDPSSEKKLKFEVNSQGLRKYLDKKINAEYRGKNIFLSWNRKSPEVIVEKSKKFKQIDFMEGFQKAQLPTNKELNDCLGFAATNNAKTTAKSIPKPQADIVKP